VSEEADDAVLAAARVMAPVTAADGFPTRSEIVAGMRRAPAWLKLVLRRLRAA